MLARSVSIYAEHRNGIEDRDPTVTKIDSYLWRTATERRFHHYDPVTLEIGM